MSEQFITPIRFGSLIGAAEQGNNTREVQGSSMFADLFQEMVDEVNRTEQEVQEKQYLLATGQLDQPHELTTAVTEAQLAVDLLSAVRTRTLDAYNELMRISM